MKFDQVKSNLRAWKPLEWVLFWIVVPAILLLIYALPQGVRDDWFILNTLYPWRLQTWFLSSYTHSQFYPHLVGNLAFYFVTLLMIFAFESGRRRFWLVASWSFCVVPFISSFLTVVLWGAFRIHTTGQGFSAIDGAFLAYAMFIMVVWGLQEILPVFDHPESFPGGRIRLQFSQALLAIMVMLIMVMGLLSGLFTAAGGSVTNGIAHFGGYVTSLLVLFIFDESTAKRRYFDTILGASILIGIVAYLYYLVLIVRLVRGL
jgi:hypothetical protein